MQRLKKVGCCQRP